MQNYTTILGIIDMRQRGISLMTAVTVMVSAVAQSHSL